MRALNVSISAVILFIALNQNAISQLGVHTSGVAAGFSNSSGDFNTFIGDSAGYTNTTGLYNTFVGYRAGYSLSFASFTQSDNTIIGAEAMGGNPFSASSTDNVIIGKMAGYNHYGTDVVIIGTHAGYFNENGADVVFIGEEAGYANTTGDDNVFVGEDAGYSNTTASDNTFIGNWSGRSNTTGYRNTFLGNESGYNNTTGERNTFIGDSAGVDVGVGHHNTFLGQASGAASEHANYNTFVGALSGWDNNRTNETNNANYNTYLGYRTGYTNREGQYNVLLGALTDFSSTAMGGNGATNSYNIGIGYDALINGERVYSCIIGSNARVSSDNSCVIGGTTSVTRMSVGIGTDTPNQNASLELAEDDKGFLITRMSNSEKTLFSSALNNTDEGMMLYDSTSQEINVWSGSQWMAMGIQSLSLNTNTLSISSGNSVNLSSYLDNTDAQNLSFDGTNLSIDNGNSVDLTSLQDGFEANTDNQNISFDGANLSIDNGNSVDLTSLQDGYEANTDEQMLSLSGNELSISGGNLIDLSIYLDNSDSQDLAFDGSNLSIVNGNSVDLTPLRDGFEANTDEQNLSLSGNDLSISGGNNVDLSSYLDNTDNQDLAFDGTNLSIVNGNSVDLTPIRDGFEANTDNQILTFSGTELSISGGNIVDLESLSSSSDNQNLLAATLLGTVLEIEIENGNPVSVNLAPLLSNINNQLIIFNDRIQQLEADVALLKTHHESASAILSTSASGAQLYECIPNPSNGATRINYFMPDISSNAKIIIYDINGRLYKNIPVGESGMKFVEIAENELFPGQYFYTLLVDGTKIDTKKMLITQ